MFSQSVSRRISTWIAVLALFVSGSTVFAQPLPGAEGTPTILGVDQWDHDIVKLQVGQPGVLMRAEESTRLVSFDLAAVATVTITVVGPPGLTARLYGENGSLLATDARGAQVLAAGRYFVRIEGALEGYEVTVSRQ